MTYTPKKGVRIRKSKHWKSNLKKDRVWRPEAGPGESMPGLFPSILSVVDGLSKFPDTVNGIGDTIRNIMDHETLIGAADSLSGIKDSLDKLARDGLAHNVDHNFGFKSTLEHLWQNKSTVGFYVCVLLIIASLVKKASKNLIIVLCTIGSLIVYKYYSDEVKSLWQAFITKFSDSMIEVAEDGYIPPQYFDRFEPQSINVAPFLKAGMFLLFSTGMSDYASESVSDFFSNSWKKIKSFPSHVDSLEKTFQFYGNVIQDMLNSFCDMIGVDHRFAFSTDLYPRATALVRDAEDFIKQTRDDDHLLVTNAAQMCATLDTKFTEMLLEYKNESRFQGGTAILLRETRARLRVLANDLELRGAGKTSTRVPPVAYMFSGQPNLGKSYFMTALTIAALGKLYANVPGALKQIRAGQDRDFWYSANLNIQHWEGYCGQLVVQVDDVGMQTDQAGVDPEKSELSKLMHMINDATYPLPFANLELKGKVEFDSSVILCTSNRAHWADLKSIVKPSAFCRRFQGWDVAVAKKFSATRSDGAETWQGLRPVHEIEDILLAEGKSEEEISYFLRNSMFLEFRKRNSILSPEVGFADDKIYTTLDVIDCLCADIAQREQQKVRKADHRQGLIDQYIPAGDQFKPQALSCPCLLCKKDFKCILSQDDLPLMNVLLGITDEKDRISPFILQGWNSVVSDDTQYSMASIPCVRELFKTAEEEQFSMVTTLVYLGRWMKRGWYISQRSMLFDFRTARVKKFLEAIGVGLAAGVAGLALYKTMSWLFSSTPPSTNVVVDCGWGPFYQKNEKGPHEEGFSAQAKDLNAREMLTSTLYRNTYLASDHIAKRWGYMTFVHDCIVAMPTHYLHRWKTNRSENEWLYLERLGDGIDGQKIHVSFDTMMDKSNHYYPFGEEADLVFVLIDSRVLPRQATMRHKVFDDVNSWRTWGEMIFPLVSRETLAITYIVSKYTEVSACYKTESDEVVHLRSAISYRAPNKQGDCGLPIALMDSNSRKKIFGIHVAGTGQKGAAVPVTRKMIDDSLEFYKESKNYFPIEAQVRTDPCVISDRSVGWDDLAEVPDADKVPGKLNLGLVDPPKNPFDTVIRPSSLYKKIVGAPPKTKPARLRPFKSKDGDLIDVEAKAASKYHQTVSEWDLKLLDLCVARWNDKFLNHPTFAVDPQVGRGRIPFENAVAGFEGVEGFDGLKRGTSAGYPLCTETKLGGKRDIFGSEGDYTFDSPEAIRVRKQVEEDIALAEQGIRGKHVCRTTMKDERRPIEKVNEGKTRAISGAPLESSIANRMEMGAFTHAMYVNRINCGSCVGMNVYEETDDLVAYLGENGDMIAGDFSGFDGKLPYHLMIRFCDSMDQFYGDEGSAHWKSRRVLMEDICNSRHVDSKGRITEWVGGNSSGNTLTSYLNSWCTTIMFYYATLLIVGIKDPGHAWKFLCDLDNVIRIVAYGDDNLGSVNPEGPYADKLTQQAYTEAFDAMGMVYTDENKGTEAITVKRKLPEVGFLKRHFVRGGPRPGQRWSMALHVDTCLEMSQWKKKRDQYEDDVRMNVKNALQELSLHDQEVFEKWRKPILDACRENMDGFVPIPNTYETCRAAISVRGGQAW